MEDLSGKQLGQYQVVSALGEGGMASVYKAYQPSMDRYVALKILPRHYASDPQFVTRFEQEARVIASLQNIHILPVHDFGESDGYSYIVMAYVETGTLADLIQGEPLPLEKISNILSQVGDALDYAHARGLVHRDVKPSNVLIDEGGNCLLTDFGIAKIVEGTLQLTKTGTLIGTPAYMSPEQIEGLSLDGRSDIYSLGVVLFEMATGRQPYRAETPAAIFVKHLHDPLPLPREINPALSEAVERVILKALAKDRDNRFDTASDLVNAFRAALQEAPDMEKAAKPPGTTVVETVIEEPAEESSEVGAAAILEETVDEATSPPAEEDLLELEKASVRPREPQLRSDGKPHRLARWALAAGGVLTALLILIALAGNRGIITVPGIPTPTVRPPGAQITLDNANRIERLGRLGGTSVDGAVSISPDGNLLASGPWLHDMESFALQDFLCDISSDPLVWSPDGTQLASGSYDGEVKVWAVEGDCEPRVLVGHSDQTRSVAWSPGGLRLASISQDDTVRIWDATEGEVLLVINLSSGAFGDVAWSPDGERVVFSDAGVPSLWNAKTGRQSDILEVEGDQVEWSPDGARLAVAGDDASVRILETATWQAERTLEGHEGIVTDLVWSPDSSMLASASNFGESGINDRKIRVWDAANGVELAVLGGHRGWIVSVDWSPDGMRIVSGDSDDNVYIWGIPGER